MNREGIVRALTLLARYDGHTFCTWGLSETSVVVDIGAHVCAFAREITDVYRCRAYCVEANPEVFRRLTETENLRVFNWALAERDGPITLWMRDNEETTGIVGSDGTPVEVPGLTLSSMLDRLRCGHVDILKLDVEGAEFGVLLTSDDATLLRCRQITIEYHDFLGWGTAQQVSEIEDRLKNLGYCPFRFVSHGNMDVLYIRCDTFMQRFVHSYLLHCGRRLYSRIRRWLGLKR
jgi:FkbM family methyltransferase